jgi:hypothetical protein
MLVPTYTGYQCYPLDFTFFSTPTSPHSIHTLMIESFGATAIEKFTSASRLRSLEIILTVAPSRVAR